MKWVHHNDWNYWCSFGPWNCHLFCKRYIKWEFRAMPGLLVAAELILTCYLTESPWIIIFGSDRQVENAGENMLIHGCASIKTQEENNGELNEKSQKCLADWLCNITPSHAIMCVLYIQVHWSFWIFHHVFISVSNVFVCASEIVLPWMRVCMFLCTWTALGKNNITSMRDYILWLA